MSWIADYRWICAQAQYDPDNVNYKAAIREFYNANARRVFTMHPWTFARKVAQIDLYGDITGGTVTLTNGGRTVAGVGTAFTSSMQGMWIQPGLTGFKSKLWAQIGRVLNSTTAYLVSPYVWPSVSGSAYTIRQRSAPMPKDCVNYQDVWDANDKSGILGYRNPFEAERIWYDEDVSGTPRWYTDADPWNPQTPERALTAVQSNTAPGALVSGRTYVYRYTWFLGEVETGASPDVEITITGGNDTVTLSGFEQTGPTDGRYARIYRAEKDVGVFYRITTTYDFTSYVDDGTITDRTYPYMDGNNIQYIRPYPRYAAGDGGSVLVRYHYAPRPIQKDTDYVEMPMDAAEAVKAYTVADVLGSVANAAPQAKYWRDLGDERVRQMMRLYITQRPNVARRRAFVGGRMSYMVGSDPTVI